MAEETFGMLLGALIKHKRKAQGLTQIQLSEDAYGEGNRVRRISELENGIVANPHPKTIDPIIAVLKITEQELEDCSKGTGGRVDDDLSEAYRDASNLIEALLYRFEHDNPEASLSEIDEFLKIKASEWRSLRKKILEIEAGDNGIEVLKGEALAALENGDFSSATTVLEEAENLQLERDTLQQISKLAKLRILRAQVYLLAGEKDKAVSNFLAAANFFSPFDKKEEILLLDSLAYSIYESSRRSVFNNFDVSDQLLSAALKVSQGQGDSKQVANFYSKIAMMHRSQSEREPPEIALKLLEKAITYCRLALEVRSPDVDLNAWASTTITLGNCLMEAGKLCDESQKRSFAEGSHNCFSEVLGKSNIDGELDELLCHASNGHGNGLMQLMTLDGVDRTEVALETYYQAIEYSKLCHDSDIWAAAHINIGNLLTNKADSSEDEKEAQYLRLRAMGAFLSALEVYPSSFFPFPFAHAQYSLGMLYFRYGFASKNELTEIYMFKSLMCFESAQSVFSEELRPRKWADMEYFKGMIFSIHAEMASNDSTEDDYKLAKTHLKEAIRVYDDLSLEEPCEQSKNLLSEVTQRLKAFLKQEKEKN